MHGYVSQLYFIHFLSVYICVYICVFVFVCVSVCKSSYLFVCLLFQTSNQLHNMAWHISSHHSAITTPLTPEDAFQHYRQLMKTIDSSSNNNKNSHNSSEASPQSPSRASGLTFENSVNHIKSTHHSHSHNHSHSHSLADADRQDDLSPRPVKELIKTWENHNHKNGHRRGHNPGQSHSNGDGIIINPSSIVNGSGSGSDSRQRTNSTRALLQSMSNVGARVATLSNRVHAMYEEELGGHSGETSTTTSPGRQNVPSAPAPSPAPYLAGGNNSVTHTANGNASFYSPVLLNHHVGGISVNDLHDITDDRQSTQAAPMQIKQPQMSMNGAGTISGGDVPQQLMSVWASAQDRHARQLQQLQGELRAERKRHSDAIALTDRVQAELELVTATHQAAEEALEAVKKERDTMTDRLNTVIAEREADLKERERIEGEREKDRDRDREMARQREISAIEQTTAEWQQRLEAHCRMAEEEADTLRGQVERLQRALKAREERHVRETEEAERRRQALMHSLEEARTRSAQQEREIGSLRAQCNTLTRSGEIAADECTALRRAMALEQQQSNQKLAQRESTLLEREVTNITIITAVAVAATTTNTTTTTTFSTSATTSTDNCSHCYLY